MKRHELVMIAIVSTLTTTKAFAHDWCMGLPSGSEGFDPIEIWRNQFLEQIAPKHLAAQRDFVQNGSAAFRDVSTFSTDSNIAAYESRIDDELHAARAKMTEFTDAMDSANQRFHAESRRAIRELVEGQSAHTIEKIKIILANKVLSEKLKKQLKNWVESNSRKIFEKTVREFNEQKIPGAQ